MAGGSDDEVAACCRGLDVAGALVIQACAQDGHLIVANKRVKLQVEPLYQAWSQLLIECLKVGHHLGETVVEQRLLLHDDVFVLEHVVIHAFHRHAQRGERIEEHEHVVHEVFVALPQVAGLAVEERDALLHLDAGNGLLTLARHGNGERCGRCGTYHLAVPQQDVPVGEQVEVVLAVAGKKQVEGLAIELVLRLALEAGNLLLTVPAHDVQVVLVVLEVEEQLCHVEGIRHQALVHHRATKPCIAGKVLKGVLHQV